MPHSTSSHLKWFLLVSVGLESRDQLYISRLKFAGIICTKSNHPKRLYVKIKYRILLQMHSYVSFILKSHGDRLMKLIFDMKGQVRSSRESSSFITIYLCVTRGWGKCWSCDSLGVSWDLNIFPPPHSSVTVLLFDLRGYLMLSSKLGIVR